MLRHTSFFRRPATILIALLAFSSLLWCILMVLSPHGVESRVFYEQGRHWLGDFTCVRNCAAEGYANALQPLYDSCYPAFGVLVAGLFPREAALSFTVVGLLLWAVSFAVFLKRVGRMPLGLKAVFFGAVLLSGVVLHAFERGNQILYATAGTTLFLAWFDTTCAVKRRMALAALAGAAVLKISPALLIVLLAVRLRDGLKDNLRSVVVDVVWFGAVGALLFFVPFAGVGGVEGFRQWLANAAANAARYAQCGAWGVVPIVRTLRIVRHQDVMAAWPGLRLEQLVGAFLGCGCLAAAGWQVVKGRCAAAVNGRLLLFVVAALLLIPGNMHFYTGLYLLPVLALRLGEDDFGWFESACWFAILCPLQIPCGTGCLNHPIANLAFLALVGQAAISLFTNSRKYAIINT